MRVVLGANKSLSSTKDFLMELSSVPFAHNLYLTTQILFSFFYIVRSTNSEKEIGIKKLIEYHWYIKYLMVMKLQCMDEKWKD